MIYPGLHNREACVEWQRAQVLTSPGAEDQTLFFPGEVLVEYNTVHLICEVLERMVDVNSMQAYRVMVTDVLAGSCIMGMATQDVNNPTLFRVRNEDTSQLGRAVLYRPRAQSRASSEDWRTANIIANDWVGKIRDRLNSSPHGDVVVQFDNVDRSGSWACIRWSADLLTPTPAQRQRWHMHVGDVVRDGSFGSTRGIVTEVNDLGNLSTSYALAQFGSAELRQQLTNPQPRRFARFLMDNMLQPHPATPDDQIGETPQRVQQGAVFASGDLQRLLSPERVRQVADEALPSMFTPNITQQLQGTLSGELLRRERQRVEGELRPTQTVTSRMPGGGSVTFDLPRDAVGAEIHVDTVGAGGGPSRDVSDVLASAFENRVTPRGGMVRTILDAGTQAKREAVREALRALADEGSQEIFEQWLDRNNDFVSQVADFMPKKHDPSPVLTPKLFGGKRKLKSL